MKTSEEIIEISKAMCSLQGAMQAAKKDKVNPHFKSSYADLTSVWEAIRQPLLDNGLCVLQDVTNASEGVFVTTRVMHVSGQWVEFGPFCIPVARENAQAIGAATSYAKRYALAAAIGVVAEVDDDGNLANENPPNRPKQSMLPTCTQAEYETFVKVMENKGYDPDDVKTFLSEGSKVRRVNLLQYTYKQMQDYINFDKNLNTFLEKRENA